MTLLVVGLPAETFDTVRREFESRGVLCRMPEGGIPRAAASPLPDAVLLASDGSEVSLHALHETRRIFEGVPVAILVANGSEDFAVRCFRAGAAEYVKDPLDRAQVSRLAGWLEGLGVRRDEPGVLIGSSPALAEVKDYIRRIAASDCNVLITGESGTGKDLAAEMIHRQSRRADRPLTCINCPAIPDTLFESEVFGFEKGAFTGAIARTPGQLEGASGGTAFLDEVAELSPAAQAKLLRVIERKSIIRIGGREPIPVDVRIIAATNCDIESLAQKGEFRHDLFFRLNVARLHLPPLRERQTDIVELINHYLAYFGARYGTPVAGIEPGTLQTMLQYSWPGNVRELKNCLERLYVSRTGDQLTFRDLPAWAMTFKEVRCASTVSESARMLAALEETRWNKRKAAAQLQWSRSTLYRKMSKYQLGIAPRSSGAA
jgi:DNA-binding NtrC family response regulator